MSLCPPLDAVQTKLLQTLIAFVVCSALRLCRQMNSCWLCKVKDELPIWDSWNESLLMPFYQLLFLGVTPSLLSHHLVRCFLSLPRLLCLAIASPIDLTGPVYISLYLY